MSNQLEKEIQRDLRNLDPDLFLDKDWSPLGYIYYSVKYRIPQAAPLQCVEWRDGNGPWPLSRRIVDVVRSQEHDMRESLASAIAANAAKRELQRQKLAENLDETSKDFERLSRRSYYLSPHPEKAAESCQDPS